MTTDLNKFEGLFSVCSLVLSIIFFFLDNNKWWAFVVITFVISVALFVHLFFKFLNRKVDTLQEKAKILFVDDKGCQIITNLKRNQFDVRKVDDIPSPSTDLNVQWANLIFVDYKDVGKRLFGKKEGLGLINELRRIYGKGKRYVIYSSAQDFDGLTEFPYMRKNGSYDEYIARIKAEMSEL